MSTIDNSYLAPADKEIYALAWRMNLLAEAYLRICAEAEASVVVPDDVRVQAKSIRAAWVADGDDLMHLRAKTAAGLHAKMEAWIKVASVTQGESPTVHATESFRADVAVLVEKDLCPPPPTAQQQRGRSDRFRAIGGLVRAMTG